MSQIKNLIANSYARELTNKEKKTYKAKTFYIPIFVIHPTGKRARSIWDFAARVNGRTINDELLPGPNLYNSMRQIQFRMRQHKILMKGTIYIQGAIERLIAIVKEMMVKVIHLIRNRTEIIDDFKLRAILIEVVRILNNRPLTLEEIDAYSDEILTPSSFIMMRTNLQDVPKSSHKICNLKKNREEIKKFTAIIWELWIKDYLPKINMRTKWFIRQESLKNGDLVLTVDTETGNSWRLGRVVGTKTGSQNQIREVEIALAL